MITEKWYNQAMDVQKWRHLKRSITAIVIAAAMAATCPAVSFAAIGEVTEGTDNVTLPVDLSDMNEETAVTDELLVVVDEDTTKNKLNIIAEDAGASLENQNTLTDGTKLAKVSVDSSEDVQTVADDLMKEDAVRLVQPNYIYSLNSDEEEGRVYEEAGVTAGEDTGVVVDDQVVGNKTIAQWYMESSSVGSSKAFEGWNNLSPSGDNVTVAVIDSGAKLDHPDIEGSIIKSKCVTFNNGKKGTFTDWDNAEDDNGHGTHVCGIIASKVGDNFGISGVSNNRVSLIVIDAALDKDHWFTTQDVVLGIDYAVKNGADIINMSLGGLYRDYIMEDAVDSAFRNNVLCVCSAGNENTSLVTSPGDSAGAVSVMAHDEKGNKASFSNYGPEKDVSAPGVNIVSCFINTKPEHKDRAIYSREKGTSMAAAVVSGLAALIKSENTALTARQLKNLIYTSSGNGNYSSFGFGRVDAVNAINNVHAVDGPQRIVLNRSSKSMYPAEYFSLEYAVYPGTASVYAEEVAFASSNPAVASVDSTGKVIAKKAGNATITATCHGNKATCTIKVSDIKYEGITKLPYKKVGYFSPTDATVRMTYKKEIWEAIVDGYELPRTVTGKPVTIKVNSTTAEPFIRAFDPSGREVSVAQRITGKYTLSASFTPNINGRYRIQVTGGAVSDATLNKRYELEITGTTVGSTVKPARKANTMVVKAKTATVKYSKLRKKARTLSRTKIMTVTKARGKVTYTKVSGSKKIKVSKTGKITIKKKTKRGKYKVRIKVTAAGDSKYAPVTKYVTVKVRVK